MIERFLHEEYPAVLDLTKPKFKKDSPEFQKLAEKFKSDSPEFLEAVSLKSNSHELLEIVEELKTRPDITNLWANFPIKDYEKPALSEIYQLIDRNYKHFLINQLALNNPQYSIVDLSYVPTNTVAKAGQTQGQPYELTTDDFKELLAALKKNTCLIALKINNLKEITITQFLELAAVLAEKNIIALYCFGNTLSETENEDFANKFAEHKTLIRLTLSENLSFSFPANAEMQTEKIKECQSIDELKQCISKLQYIPAADYLYASGEIIYILENNKLAVVLTKLESLTTYGLLDKIKTLGDKKPDSTSSILEKLEEMIPKRPQIGEKVEHYFKVLVESCKTLEQLQKLLSDLEYDIQGKNSVLSPKKILKAIDLIMADKVNLTKIPHYAGLRKKVEELKNKMEVIPETPPLNNEFENNNEDQADGNGEKNNDEEQHLNFKRRKLTS